MNMKKTIRLIPLCATLFWACSDSPDVTGTTIIDNTVAQEESSSSEIQKPESSSSQPNGGIESSSSKQQSSSSNNLSFKIGTCNPDEVIVDKIVLSKQAAFDADIAAALEELPKAYILHNNGENYQVFISNVRDYCAVRDGLLTKRSGDTLEIKYGGMEHASVTACLCNSDHWFDINAEDKDAKFIKFKKIVYEVSDDPVPESSKPDNDSTATQTDTTSAQNDTTSTQNDSTFTDTRDGKTYRTVKLGERIWMAENLNYEMDDGIKSWCNGNKQENCDKYGRLYTYKSATYACPPGWRLPAVEEWPERGNGGYPAFVDYAVVGWGGGKDTYGFSVLSAGNYSAKSQYFHEPGGTTTFFWTMTIDTRNNNCATMIHFGNGSEGMVSVCADSENDGLSVRCMKD
jgi:uncharacterized protein (TIGR02145 family)